jgi:hypothetical protein
MWSCLVMWAMLRCMSRRSSNFSVKSQLSRSLSSPKQRLVPVPSPNTSDNHRTLLNLTCAVSYCSQCLCPYLPCFVSQTQSLHLPPPKPPLPTLPFFPKSKLSPSALPVAEEPNSHRYVNPPCNASTTVYLAKKESV